MPMTILVNMKLGNKYVDYYFRPLIQLESVDRIFIVRDYPGPNLPKVKYCCPPKPFSLLPPLAALYKLSLLIYISLSKKPNLIHSFLLFPHGVLAFIAAKFTRRPVGISLIAGPLELYSIGSPLGVKYSETLPWLGKYLLKILKHSDIITTTGHFTRKFLINREVDRNKIYVLPEIANKDYYHPLDTPKIYDVLWVGRLAPVKRGDIFLEVISQVRRKYADIRVGIVGDGPCKVSLQELSNHLGIDHNVEFLGWKEDVPYYYNSSKMFMLTSEREGMPGVLFEAMMCGTPVITSNCGDVIDIAQNGTNCIVIQDYNDIGGFANAVISLLKDEQLRHKLSYNAIKTMEGISMEKITRTWEIMLKELQSRD